MTNSITASPRPNYGIDAPPVIRNLALSGIAAIAAGVILYLALRASLPSLAITLGVWGAVAGTGNLLTAAAMIWSSKVGKLIMRRKLIDSLHLRGDEQVLDVGCGRGLLLIEAARHLSTGMATGIDLWKTVDQSGNSPDATLTNGRAEGVAERIRLETGDMTVMPFPDSSFDVIVSSLAIHNIPSKEGRIKAIQEIDRVAKSGARIALLDYTQTALYEQALREAGWQDVQRSGLSFLMFPPVRVVTGHKP